MRNFSRRLALFAIPFAVASVALVPGCKSGESKDTVVAPKSGNMPEGATWDGVYFNPQFGNLHLVETGTSIAGKWKRTDGSAWGELNGPVQGNVFHFEWTEHKIGLVGPSATVKGKGFFVYKRPAGDNVDDTLDGQWGLNDKESGETWDCIKQRHVKPDLKSIGGQAEPGGVSKDWQ
jgi:hypothetical protein